MFGFAVGLSILVELSLSVSIERAQRIEAKDFYKLFVIIDSGKLCKAWNSAEVDLIVPKNYVKIFFCHGLCEF